MDTPGITQSLASGSRGWRCPCELHAEGVAQDTPRSCHPWLPLAPGLPAGRPSVPGLASLCVVAIRVQNVLRPLLGTVKLCFWGEYIWVCNCWPWSPVLPVVSSAVSRAYGPPARQPRALQGLRGLASTRSFSAVLVGVWQHPKVTSIPGNLEADEVELQSSPCVEGPGFRCFTLGDLFFLICGSWHLHAF